MSAGISLLSKSIGMISSRDFLRGKSAAIFDFDGTLGDTIDLWNKVDVELATELGYPGLDSRECHAFREAALRRYKNQENPYRCYCGDFAKRIGCSLSAEEVHVRRYRISRRMLREDVRLREGAAAALKRIKSLGLRMALATTTRRANIEIYCRQNQNILDEIHLDEVFEHFVCAEDVRNIKPDPECYLKAIDYLGLPAEAIFAVEDTLSGVEAAVRAGLVCIGIREENSVPDAEEIKARTAIYFDDYAAFLAWLG